MCSNGAWIAIQSGASFHRRERDDVKFLELWHSVWHQAEGDLCVPVAVRNDDGADRGGEVSSDVGVTLDCPVHLRGDRTCTRILKEMRLFRRFRPFAACEIKPGERRCLPTVTSPMTPSLRLSDRGMRRAPSSSVGSLWTRSRRASSLN